VWVRSAAIRPVPAFAQLTAAAIEESESWLGGEDDVTEQRLSEAFERFETEQPVLARHVGNALTRSGDDIAVALGYFMTLVIWLAFDSTFSSDLRRVSETDLTGVEEALDLDEQLRGSDPAEAVDSDDVVAMEQPHIMSFVHQHIDVALDVHAGDIDVDAIHRVYRVILVELLVLSYSVRLPEDVVTLTSEIYA
jgi:hypothetical protein